MTTTVEITVTDVIRHREDLHAWLRAHDLTPETTAPGLIVRDGQITATVYVVDEAGQKQLLRDPFSNTVLGVQTTVVVLPVRTPLSAHLGTVIA